MTRKLTDKYIDEQLKLKNIKKLSPNNGTSKITKFLCLVESCNYIWSTKLGHVIHDNSGCPKCSNRVKLTNEEFDQKLLNRNIKRVDDYISADDKITFVCLINDCGYKWQATPHGIGNGKTGCPQCTNHIKLTNDIIDKRLKNKNIKRMSDYIENKETMSFLCLIENCNYYWKTIFSSIDGGTGCPQCVGKAKLTNEIIDEKLISRLIKRLDNHINANTPVLFRCEIESCQHEWLTTTNSILNKRTGCPKCAGLLKLNNDIIDQRLKNRLIKRIGDCKGSNVKINFQCLIKNCNKIWSTTPSSILNRKSGCPRCSIGKNERLVDDILSLHKIDYELHKSIKNIIAGENRRIYVDFYLSNEKIIIEYNGAQHYQLTRFGSMNYEEAKNRLVKQQERDQYLQQFCDRHDIKLIWIDGRKYTNSKLETHMHDEIIPIITKI